MKSRHVLWVLLLGFVGGCEDLAGTGEVRHYTAVATGGGHSCAVAESGEAYCWGANRYGQLANGGASDQFSPSRVSGDIRFADITAGELHTCALDVDGAAYCWGWGWLYQLGNGTQYGMYGPASVAGDMRFTQLSAGAYHTCGLGTDRQVYCWGHNNWGQVGNGTLEDVPTPVPVGEFQAISVSAGGWHTCAVAEGGQTYCWGRNDSGQLGIETIDPIQALTPMQVRTNVRFRTVEAGDTHTCGISMQGMAYCWGSATYGELGDQQIWKDGLVGASVPVPVFLLPAVKEISAGKNHTCAIDTTGLGYCWGRNEEGQLGNGRTANASVRQVIHVSPTARLTGDLFHFTKIASGGTTHACGLVEGSVFCWGTGNTGSLGAGSSTYSTLPQRISE